MRKKLLHKCGSVFTCHLRFTLYYRRINLAMAGTAFLICLLASNAFAQKKVTGKVTDEQNQPLTGVSIRVKSLNMGTQTDVNGAYSLNVPDEKSVLVFSYVGFETKEQSVNVNSNVLDVTLKQNASALNEVVVVGYGTQRKGDITGSVATVTSESLDRVKAISASNMLAGKLPGVSFRNGEGRPGANANIQIRNMGTPLFIIDGIQKDVGQFNNIAPNDIESITVLKDGAAAVYGSRAANGVVVVTTKQGERGQAPRINVDSYYGLQNWARYPDIANAYQWKLGEVDANINMNGALSLYQGDAQKAKDEIEKYKAGTEYGYRNFDWYDFIVGKNAPQTSLNANVSGGSNNVNYYLSATKLHQEAVYGDNFTFDRTNIQSNVNANVTKSLKAGIQINGRVESRENPNMSGNNPYGNAVNALTSNLPFQHPYANDNPLYLARIKDPATNFGILKDNDKSGLSNDDWRVLQANFNLEYQFPLKGLSARGLYSYYVADHTLDNFEKMNYQMYSYDPETDTYNKDGDPVFNPWRNRELGKIIENVYQAQLSFKRSLGKHHIDALALMERINRSDKNGYQAAVPKTTDLWLMNFNDFVGSYYRDVLVETARIGYVGRINYNYDDRYYLEGSFRRDASSLFPEDKRWGTFPSVSAGWRISRENFFRSLNIEKVVSDLKFRASYGILGDDNIGLAQFFYLDGYRYNVASVPFGEASLVTSSKYTGVPSENISWYERHMFNAGADFGLFNNSLTGSVEYFYGKRTGLIARKNDVVLPTEIGYALPQENLQSDAQMGGEIALNYNNSKHEFAYRIGGNFSYSRHKYLDVYNPVFGNSYDYYRHSIENRWDPIYWGYKTIGQFQSVEQIANYPVDVDGQGNKTLLPGDLIYKDLNGDNKIDDYDVSPIGWPSGGQPIFNLGLTLGFGYKGFDLAADFSGGFGYSYNINWENRWAYQSGNALLSKFYEDRWHRADPFDPNSEWVAGKNLPLRFNNGGHNNYNKGSDYWLRNVRYLKARTIELGYTIPKRITDKVKIQKLRFYINTFNLFSLDNMSDQGLDPEIYYDNGRVYPQNKLTNFGINLTL